MTTFPGSPRLVKGGLVLVDPDSAAVRRVITLQYNPDTLTRSLQIPGGASQEGQQGSEALRLKGPPVETIRLEAEIDAADQLEFPDQYQNTVQFGIHPYLAALEGIVYPTAGQLQDRNDLARWGTIEISPAESSLVLFVWSSSRIVPVRVTEMSITEEAFDPNLNPLRAKVTLGLRVLSINDLGFDHLGARIFLSYLKAKESLAGKSPSGSLQSLGIDGGAIRG